MIIHPRHIAPFARPIFGRSFLSLQPAAPSVASDFTEDGPFSPARDFDSFVFQNSNTGRWRNVLNFIGYAVLFSSAAVYLVWFFANFFAIVIR